MQPLSKPFKVCRSCAVVEQRIDDGIVYRRWRLTMQIGPMKTQSVQQSDCVPAQNQVTLLLAG